jgi:hypothetical protein
MAEPREETAAPRRESPGLVVTLVIALATPAALGVETLLRVLLLPAEIAGLREDLRPALTPLAWGLVALTCLAVPLGFATRSAMERRLLAKAEPTPKKRAEAAFEAVFVGTSVPQIPALLATIALTAGAEALPVLLAVGVSAAAVVAIAQVPRKAPRDGSSAAAG